MALSPGDIYELPKVVWTHEDFDQMGWHDVTVHAITFDPERFEFSLDIDYIFAWVNPEPPSPYYSFWISPATLIFHNIGDFRAELDGPIGLEISDLRRKDPHPPKNAEFISLKTEWTWTIELVRGEINFPAAGFTQYTRRKPIRNITGQCFSLQERGGISFDRTSVGL
jgi:hypothetical protein